MSVSPEEPGNDDDIARRFFDIAAQAMGGEVVGGTYGIDFSTDYLEEEIEYDTREREIEDRVTTRFKQIYPLAGMIYDVGKKFYESSAQRKLRPWSLYFFIPEDPFRGSLAEVQKLEEVRVITKIAALAIADSAMRIDQIEFGFLTKVEAMAQVITDDRLDDIERDVILQLIDELVEGPGLDVDSDEGHELIVSAVRAQAEEEAAYFVWSLALKDIATSLERYSDLDGFAEVKFAVARAATTEHKPLYAIMLQQALTLSVSSGIPVDEVKAIITDIRTRNHLDLFEE